MFNDTILEASFKKHAKLMSIAEGEILMNPGEYFRMIPIIISGCIRVLRQNSDGNEIFLYHLMPGETCAMSLTCCNNQSPSEVKTIAEEDTELWAIPIFVLDEWQQHKEWRDFIAATYNIRFNKLLLTINELAFENMIERLWRYLEARSKAKDSDILNINHEEIARELNIQRESATRLIKKLKDLGLVETGRGHLKLLKNEIISSQFPTVN
jgi:CRP/FNR family transcriptional regulator